MSFFKKLFKKEQPLDNKINMIEVEYFLASKVASLIDSFIKDNDFNSILQDNTLFVVTNDFDVIILWSSDFKPNADTLGFAYVKNLPEINNIKSIIEYESVFSELLDKNPTSNGLLDDDNVMLNMAVDNFAKAILRKILNSRNSI